MRFYREVVLSYDGDECLTWPYARSSKGYGTLQYDGSTKRVHRLVCEAVNGPPPTPQHEAAHLCGKGHEGCCAPRHLEWKTRAENAADMMVHGTSNRGERNGRAKLTSGEIQAGRGWSWL